MVTYTVADASANVIDGHERDFEQLRNGGRRPLKPQRTRASTTISTASRRPTWVRPPPRASGDDESCRSDERPTPRLVDSSRASSTPPRSPRDWSAWGVSCTAAPRAAPRTLAMVAEEMAAPSSRRTSTSRRRRHVGATHDHAAAAARAGSGAPPPCCRGWRPGGRRRLRRRCWQVMPRAAAPAVQGRRSAALAALALERPACVHTPPFLPDKFLPWPRSCPRQLQQKHAVPAGTLRLLPILLRPAHLKDIN